MRNGDVLRLQGGSKQGVLVEVVDGPDVAKSLDVHGRGNVVDAAPGGLVFLATECLVDDPPPRQDRRDATATALFLDGKPQALIEQLSHLAPLQRLGQPEDIANVVSFLAGPDGAWVNGQVLRANRGVV